MSKTQYYCAASLDGFIADADDGLDWLLDYEGSSVADGAEPGPMGPDGSYEHFYGDVGALASGSTTYEFVFDHLGEDDDWPYAGKPYWVLSSRDLAVPDAADVDVRIVSAAVAELHEQMTETASGRNLWIVGGGNVASQFAEAGLLDEVLVTVVPVVLGAGKPLFDNPLPGGAMKLLATRTFTSGMVELRYDVER